MKSVFWSNFVVSLFANTVDEVERGFTGNSDRDPTECRMDRIIDRFLPIIAAECGTTDQGELFKTGRFFCLTSLILVFFFFCSVGQTGRLATSDFL